MKLYMSDKILCLKESEDISKMLLFGALLVKPEIIAETKMLVYQRALNNLELQIIKCVDSSTLQSEKLLTIYNTISQFSSSIGLSGLVKVYNGDVSAYAPGITIVIDLDLSNTMSYVLDYGRFYQMENTSDYLTAIKFKMTNGIELSEDVEYVQGSGFREIRPLDGTSFLTGEIEIELSEDDYIAIGTRSKTKPSYEMDVASINLGHDYEPKFTVISDQIVQIISELRSISDLEMQITKTEVSKLKYDDLHKYGASLAHLKELKDSVTFSTEFESRNALLYSTPFNISDVNKIKSSLFLDPITNCVVGVPIMNSNSAYLNYTQYLSTITNFNASYPNYEIRQNQMNNTLTLLKRDISKVEKALNKELGMRPCDENDYNQIVAKFDEFNTIQTRKAARLAELALSAAAIEALDVLESNLSDIIIRTPCTGAIAIFNGSGYSVNNLPEEMHNGKPTVVYNPALATLFPSLKAHNHTFVVKIASPETCDQANTEDQCFTCDFLYLEDLNNAILDNIRALSENVIETDNQLALLDSQAKRLIEDIIAIKSKQDIYELSMIKINQLFMTLAKLKQYERVTVLGNFNSFIENKAVKSSEIAQQGYIYVGDNNENIKLSPSLRTKVERALRLISTLELNYSDFTAADAKQLIDSWKITTGLNIQIPALNHSGSYTITSDYSMQIGTGFSFGWIIGHQKSSCGWTPRYAWNWAGTHGEPYSWGRGVELKNKNASSFDDIEKELNSRYGRYAWPRVAAQRGELISFRDLVIKSCANDVKCTLNTKYTINKAQYLKTISADELTSFVKSLDRKNQTIADAQIKNFILNDLGFRDYIDELINQDRQIANTISQTKTFNFKVTQGHTAEWHNGFPPQYYIDYMNYLEITVTGWYNAQLSRVYPSAIISSMPGDPSPIRAVFADLTTDASQNFHGIPFNGGRRWTTPLDRPIQGVLEPVPSNYTRKYEGTKVSSLAKYYNKTLTENDYYTIINSYEVIKDYFNKIFNQIKNDLNTYITWYNTIIDGKIENSCIGANVYDNTTKLPLTNEGKAFTIDIDGVKCYIYASNKSLASDISISDDLNFVYGIEQTIYDSEQDSLISEEEILNSTLTTIGGFLTIRNLESTNWFTKQEMLNWLNVRFGIGDNVEAYITGLGPSISSIIQGLEEVKSTQLRMDFPTNDTSALISIIGIDPEQLFIKGLSAKNITTLLSKLAISTFEDTQVIMDAQTLNINDLSINSVQNYNYTEKVRLAKGVTITQLRDNLIKLENFVKKQSFISYDGFSKTFVKYEPTVFTNIAFNESLDDDYQLALDVYFTKHQLVILSAILQETRLRNQQEYFALQQDYAILNLFNTKELVILKY